MTSTTLTILLFLFLAPLRVSGQCYNPDGTLAGGAYQPCASDRPSMCCALNRTGTGGNSCRSDNLCVDADNISLWRESCTDPTWKDPACLQLCVEGTAQGLIGGIDVHTRDSPLTMCSDGSICCGLRNDICCTMKNGLWLVNGTVYSYEARPSGVLLTAPSTTASFIPPLNRDGSASTISGSANPETNSRTTLRIALGVGLGVGIAVLLAIIANMVTRLRRRANEVSRHDGEVLVHEPTGGRNTHPAPGQQTGGRVDEFLVDNLETRELDSLSSPKELNSYPGSRGFDLYPTPVELDHNSVPGELDSNPVSKKLN